MSIRNNSQKTIAFGSAILVPGGVITLPPEYSADHPMIEYYQRMKMIAMVSDAPPSSEIKPEPDTSAKSKPKQ
jgi:hypothetical protein